MERVEEAVLGITWLSITHRADAIALSMNYGSNSLAFDDDRKSVSE